MNDEDVKKAINYIRKVVNNWKVFGDQHIPFKEALQIIITDYELRNNSNRS